jgi:hypothetical protein
MPNFKNTSSLPTGFEGTFGIDMVPDSDGLLIESGDAIDNGADLDSSLNGAINLSGRSGGWARPQGTRWDIGAYEAVTIFPPDTTPPANISTVNDGSVPGPDGDIDSTYSTNQLSANWSASSDPDTGISRYEYAIGLTPGGSDIVEWTSTSNGTVTGVTESGLSLTVGMVYYFTVKAVNGVSLRSNPISSDGQVVCETDLNPQDILEKIEVWSNPFSPKSGNKMKFTNLPSNSTLKIYTLSGKLVCKLYGEEEINWDGRNEKAQVIAPGLYVYVVTDDQRNKKTGKLAVTR